MICSDFAAKNAFMKSLRDSGFYAWAKRLPSKRVVENSRLKVAIAVAHKRTQET